ncbi:uncharacterized protein LOC125033456 [Penaeus chinensis]|uniref:uncharacterized protein LOC125033456 n=1 Tax=Penaeus chinensis TaxID=139456 RepID=UPI001FB6B49C|nr:uncharacterized protein LOC125033456 [Penaeus chinensis]
MTHCLKCWTPMRTAVVCSGMLNRRCMVNNKRQLLNPYFLPRRLISEEKKIKILEERKKMREAFQVKEAQWESLVDRSLLLDKDVKIYEEHKAAVARGHFTYDDPLTGYRVMTRLRHFLRGSCCGNACRHCIYDHENVADIDKARRIYNSAFWVDISERPDLVKRNKSYAKSSLNMTDRRKEFGRGREDELLEEYCDPLLFKH